MKLKICLFIPIAACLMSACSSGPSVRVVEQSDSKPSWASLTRTTYEDSGNKYFVGYFTADGDSRPSAVVNGSKTKALAMPLESISDDFLQQSGVAEDDSGSSSKLIISALRKNPPNIPGLQITSNYYERVEIQNGDGTAKNEIRAYSLAVCPVAEYNQAKHDALARLKGDPKVKKELDDIMAKQRDRALENSNPSDTSSSN